MLEENKFDKKFYDDHAREGADYLHYGYWQQQYGWLVAETALQQEYQDPFVIDVGCACGAMLKGFKETGLFARVAGIDLSDHMIGLGRTHLGFTDSELIVGSATDMPFETGTASLVHSQQVLEHIPSEQTNSVVAEIARVLRPGGRVFIGLPALRHGDPPTKHTRDPTHVNIKPTLYWTTALQQFGLQFDVESFERYARSARGPEASRPALSSGARSSIRPFWQHYPGWSLWTLIKTDGGTSRS
jgi:ubiquinone/menaquinone biosynthesis C-methylase UbiE